MSLPDLAKKLTGAVRDRLGEPIVWDPVVSDPGAPARELQGVFRQRFFENDLGDQGVVSGQEPILTLVESYFTADPAPADGDRATIRGKVYQVWGPPEYDGQAKFTLRLKLTV